MDLFREKHTPQTEDGPSRKARAAQNYGVIVFMGWVITSANEWEDLHPKPKYYILLGGFKARTQMPCNKVKSKQGLVKPVCLTGEECVSLQRWFLLCRENSGLRLYIVNVLIWCISFL